tara:strand:+ start:8613 stop:9275 length:663 start_codon:yes stop_codon:yes gene_type:complete
MPRKKRILVPDFPHHITQRGTRRERMFFVDQDYRLYLKLLCEWGVRESVDIWSFCLMPNHVHLILVPKTNTGISNMIGSTHRRYARYINDRNDWTGNLWQERFNFSVLDEAHLLNAVRYVEQNPVRAGLVAAPQDWKWSSARTHLYRRADGITKIDALDAYITDWQDYLNIEPPQSEVEFIRKSALNCLPVAKVDFIQDLERKFNIKLRPPVLGRPCKES